MAVYTNDLRLKEIATGDESGTWGTSTNTNLELIAEAFSFGTEAITTNADTHTTTIADGSTDPGRSLFLKYTGTLDSACTITIGPNTVSKLWLIENATSGGFSIIIKQGSGATVTVPNGQTKAIYSDGAGSGGAMVDAFTDLSVPSLFVSGNLDVDGTTNLDVVDIDGAVDFASTTAHAGNATFADNAKAIFGAGSDLQIFHDGTHSVIDDTGTGNLILQSNGAQISLQSSTELYVTAANNGSVTAYHNGSAKLATTSTGIDVTGSVTATSLDISGDIDVDGTTNLDVVDIDGAVAMASTLIVGGTTPRSGFVADFQGTSGNAVNIQTGDEASDISLSVGSVSTPDKFVITAGGSVTATGVVTANAGVVVDNITIDGTQIDLSSGDLTIDVAGEIILDADGAVIRLKDGGTEFGKISQNSNNLRIFSSISDADLLFQGNDGGSTITALTLDMSAAGAATFNSSVTATDVNITSNTPIVRFTESDQSDKQYQIGSFGSAFAINDASNTQFRYVLDTNGNHVFNEGGVDADFRVESDGNTHMLFVDGGNDRVGIGTSSPSSVLHAIGGSATTSSTASDFLANATARLVVNHSNQYGAYIGYVNSSNDAVGIQSARSNATVGPLSLNTFGGNVGISTSSPRGVLDLGSGSGDGTLSNTPSEYQLILEAAQSATGDIGRNIAFVNSSNNVSAAINAYDAGTGVTNGLMFATASSGTLSEAARFDSSGNLLVGKTASGTANTGAELRDGSSNHAVIATSTSETPLVVNRKTNDGSLVNLLKDGTTVGSIGSYNSATGIISGSAASYTGIYLNTNKIEPAGNNFGSEIRADNTVDIGSSSYRFKDLYLSGGVFLGGTGSANKLEDYEEGTWTPTVAGDATGAFSIAEATYTKIGRLVFIEMYVVVSTNFSSNFIGGLPFTAANLLSGTSFAQSATCLLNNADVVTAAAQEGSTNLKFFNDHGALSDHDLNTAVANYRLSVCYQTS